MAHLRYLLYWRCAKHSVSCNVLDVVALVNASFLYVAITVLILNIREPECKDNFVLA